MTYDQLINQQTGEFDWSAIKKFAFARAQVSYRGPKPTAHYIRSEISSLKQYAGVQRRRWREAHGLPDDTVYVTTVVPLWGNAGDSFGRGQ